MTGYEILVFLHVAGAALWVGGGVLIGLLLTRAKRSGGETMRTLVDQAAWLGGRYFGTVGFLVLALGIWMVSTSDVWSFSDFWVAFGLAGYVLSAVIGGAVLGPLAKRTQEAIATTGPDSGEAKAALGRFLTVARIDTLVLLAVVFDMVTKPGA